MKCDQCGRSISEEDRICPSCGAETARAVKAKGRAENVVMALVGGAIVIGFAVFIAIQIANSNKQTEEGLREKQDASVVYSSVIQPELPLDASSILQESVKALQVRVPQLVGVQGELAKQMVEGAKLAIAIQLVESEEPVGQVIAQTIPEDTQVDEGTEIGVTVSMGKASIEESTDVLAAGETESSSITTESSLAQSESQASQEASSATPPSVIVSSGDYVLPQSGSVLLSAADLAGLDKAQLRLARNEILARHGRTFNDKSLQAYFDSKSWYGAVTKLPVGVEPKLNAIEYKNIELIKEFERR